MYCCGKILLYLLRQGAKVLLRQAYLYDKELLRQAYLYSHCVRGYELEGGLLSCRTLSLKEVRAIESERSKRYRV